MKIKLDVQRIENSSISEIIQLNYQNKNGNYRHIGAYYGRNGLYTRVMQPVYTRSRPESVRLTREQVMCEVEEIIKEGVK